MTRYSMQGTGFLASSGFAPGVDLYFGSDGMPHGVQEALRQALFSDGGYEGQVLTLDEFIAGYCLPDTSDGSIDVEVDPIRRVVTWAGS